MLYKSREANVYKMDDISEGLSLCITGNYTEFVKEGENGFYFAYFSLQKFIDRIEGNVFSDRENEDSDIVSIDLDYYANLFREML